MELPIQILLAEVPADFQPTFDAKPPEERVVGTLDDLDADTRRIVVGVHYFAEQVNALFTKGKALSEAHQLEHQQEGFVPGGESCRTNHSALDTLQEQIETLQEKCGTLQAASGPTLFEQFKIQPGEQLALRTEGITAAPPEPQDPLLAMIQRLASQGVGVQVIGVGPGGQLTELSPGSPTGFTTEQED